MKKRMSQSELKELIEVKRYPGLYVVIDKRTTIILAKIAIEDDASDLINSRLRDDIVKLCYQYGKEIGNY